MPAPHCTMGLTRASNGRRADLPTQALTLPLPKAGSVVGAGPHAGRIGSGRGRRGSAWLRIVLLLALFLLESGRSQLVGPENAEPVEFGKLPQLDFYFQYQNHQAASERQEQFRLRVPIPDAVGAAVPNAFNPVSPAVPTPAADADPFVIIRHGFLFLGVVLLGGFLAARKFAPELITALNQHVNPWAKPLFHRTDATTPVRAEEAAFAEFLVEFQSGPAYLAGPSPFAAMAARASAPAEAFLKATPTHIEALRKLLRELAQTCNPGRRRALLADLNREIMFLKRMADQPEFLPVWQLAHALDGLVNQLITKAGDCTPSTLRTMADGVELFKMLCVPGLRADLSSNPPIRLLAVDDDMICRNAVSRALKKAFNQPDLAADSESTLALTDQHAYDVIFLDVQMPGMDGFELCTKIHESGLNAATPVVFVTCLSDFEARATSTLCGGHDLMGKPFLSFEITVKALTLALRSRLERELTAATQDSRLSPAARNTCLATPARSGPRLGGSGSRPVQVDGDHSPDAWHPVPAFVSPPDEPVGALVALGVTQIRRLRESMDMILQSVDAEARQGLLAEVYVGLNSLAPKTNEKVTQPTGKLIAALEALLKKLLETPKHSTPSSLTTLATGIEMLERLHALPPQPDMAAAAPVRILVVDDDPVTRRALGCALQMAFEQPASADCGEAALALTREEAFDVIFLDVQMPGLDGYAVCSSIRERGPNQTTPVVFVTGQNDVKARTLMNLSGGNDFICKPFIKAEITLKALTYALAGWIRKSQISKEDTRRADPAEPRVAPSRSIAGRGRKGAKPRADSMLVNRS